MYLYAVLLFLLCILPEGTDNLTDGSDTSYSLWDFPVFNVADCYVVVGALLLIVLIFTLYRNDNFECLNPGKE